MKIYVTGHTRSNELAIYERINSVSAGAEDVAHKTIRKLLSTFEVRGPRGIHTFIVHEALGISMDHLMSYLPNKSLGLEESKLFLRQLLVGLDFLYTQAGLIHTGK